MNGKAKRGVNIYAILIVVVVAIILSQLSSKEQTPRGSFVENIPSPKITVPLEGMLIGWTDASTPTVVQFDSPNIVVLKTRKMTLNGEAINQKYYSSIPELLVQENSKKIYSVGYDLSLAAPEGTNVVELEFETNRGIIKKQFRFTKDTVPPTFKITNPREGQFSVSDVSGIKDMKIEAFVRGDVQDVQEKPILLGTNNGESIYKISYPLENLLITITDNAGNTQFETFSEEITVEQVIESIAPQNLENPSIILESNSPACMLDISVLLLTDFRNGNEDRQLKQELSYFSTLDGLRALERGLEEGNYPQTQLKENSLIGRSTSDINTILQRIASVVEHEGKYLTQYDHRTNARSMELWVNEYYKSRNNIVLVFVDDIEGSSTGLAYLDQGFAVIEIPSSFNGRNIEEYEKIAYMAKTIAHEIGHLFGLDHYPLRSFKAKQQIMYFDASSQRFLFPPQQALSFLAHLCGEPASVLRFNPVGVNKRSNIHVGLDNYCDNSLTGLEWCEEHLGGRTSNGFGNYCVDRQTNPPLWPSLVDVCTGRFGEESLCDCQSFGGPGVISREPKDFPPDRSNPTTTTVNPGTTRPVTQPNVCGNGNIERGFGENCEPPFDNDQENGQRVCTMPGGEPGVQLCTKPTCTWGPCLVGMCGCLPDRFGYPGWDVKEGCSPMTSRESCENEYHKCVIESTLIEEAEPVEIPCKWIGP